MICKTCKSEITAVRKINTGLFLILIFGGLFIITPLVIMMGNPSEPCPDHKSIAECIRDAEKHVETHVPTDEMMTYSVVLVIISVMVSQIPAMLYYFVINSKTCPLCNDVA